LLTTASRRRTYHLKILRGAVFAAIGIALLQIGALANRAR
jgi:hypothetical protein